MNNDLVSNPFSAAQQAPSNHAGNAVAASEQQRAIAEIQAAMMIAQNFPRNPIAAMDRILNSCTRPSLANAAVYSYAKGGTDINGPSIRLAEAIAQQWGNMKFGFSEMSRGTDRDGVGYSEVKAFAWDLETNTERPLSFRVRHWIDTKGGGRKTRDEREIYELVANMAQRRVRACILSIVPGDVTEAALDQCSVTMHATADTSPDAVQKLVAAFAAFGVSKTQLEARIQRRLDAIQPAQIVSLRKIYASIKDKISATEDWFPTEENRQPEQRGAHGLKAAAMKSHSNVEPPAAQIDYRQPVTIPQQAVNMNLEPVGEEWRPAPEEEAAIRPEEMADSQSSGKPPARQRRERSGLGME